VKGVIFTNFRMHPGNNLIGPAQRAFQQLQWQERIRPYRSCNNVYLIYIFIIEGYKALLSGEIPFESLTTERAMREVLETAVRMEGLEDRVQIVGIDELIPTLTYLQQIAHLSGLPLNNLLLGAGKTAYYDSPKMVEAFIRLARGLHVGPEEVIIRMDEDVALNPRGIDALIKYYDDHPHGANSIEYRFLSGDYRCHDSEDLLNDYAVRTTHFARIGIRELRKGDPNYNEAKLWLDSIADIGADPYNQTISGAGLMMSPKSIMTLPPFANAGSPIIWIDDHLKRLLHEALGHFNYLKDNKPPLNISSYRYCKGASFEQDRYPNGVQQKDIVWAGNDYLPRLVRGIVMDNLIWDRASSCAGVYTGYVDNVINGSPVPGKNTLRTALQPESMRVLDTIEKDWKDKKRIYNNKPLRVYAKTLLPKQKAKLIDEVADAFHSYLQLLKIWPTFVVLWQQILPSDPSNRWLYRT